MGTAILETFVELAPWLLLGMVVAGALHGLLPEDFVRRQLRGSLGVVKAVMLGVPLPLCSCGVIPTGLGLKKDGASDGASIGFLISTPQTGVDSILVSASFLGWPFALFKVVSAAVTGLLGGWLADAGAHDASPDEAAEDRSDAQASEPRDLRGMFAHSLDLLASIWRWLVFGIVVSAAIQVFVPPGTFARLDGFGSIGAGLAALVISLPLYICATASVPIAAAMVANGLPTGAALVFLMAGPATNVATIGTIYRGFGARILGIYLGTIIVGSLGFGVLFDWTIASTSTSAEAHHHAEMTWWAAASSVLLAALLARLAFRDLRRFVLKHWPGGGAGAVEIRVSGMTCGGCATRLEDALRVVSGVDSVLVSRNPDVAVLRGHADRVAVDRAIRDAGFQVG
jgi:uncharacterized membrane protein YraQ (UPF0718 family)/copper chaperone CopZ